MKPEIAQRILAALTAKIPVFPPCWVCGNKTWNLSDGWVVQVLQSDIGHPLAFGGPSMPCVAVTCNNCGHVVFMNLIALGLPDLFFPKISEIPNV